MALAAVLLAGAQDPSPALRILESRAAGGRAQIVVAAADSTGQPLRELSAANFQVEVEGAAVADLAVERATETGKPLSLLLLMDVSGSMRGAGISAAQRAASALLDQLDKEDHCSLMTFGSDVRTAVEFTRERLKIRDAIGALAARDAQTHLYQALLEAVERASAAPSSRTAILALTDGKDEGSGVSAQDVIQKATAAGVPLFLLGFGTRVDAEPLRRIASLTRGGFYSTPDPAELAKVYLAILEQLKTNYQLSFAFPKSEPGRYAVRVTLSYRGSSQSAAQTLAWPPGGEAVAATPSQAPEVAAGWWRIALGLLLLAGAGAGGWFYWRRHQDQKKEQDLGGPDITSTIVAPRVWIEVVRGADTGLKLPLVGSECIIGRIPGAVQILLKNDPMVGRKHARIYKNSRGQFVLEDLGSANGTSVNGVEVSQPVVLNSNDRIGVGQSELLFVDNR
jgi:uncharacterized protein YegL